MDKALLVYNPFSGDQSIPQKLDYIINRFQKQNILLQPFRMVNDKGKMLTKVLKGERFKFLISSGGDGTLNFVSNIILKENLGVPMGIIPSGTCNDFASILNIPSTLEENLDIILAGKTAGIDVGVVDDKTYFLSSCAGGVLVDVSFNTHSELKKNFGPFAYYLKALSEMANMKPFRLRVETENETVEEDVLLFIILNGKQAGGFSNIIKEADFSDGLMDIVLIKNCNHIDLAGIFFQVLSNDALNNKNVINLRANKCTIQGSRDIVLSIDGEKGPCLPTTVRFINKALEVFLK
ncbi:MAG: YegS/Rv2252/BmrU family lipid kinase [Bacillota bacterium]